MNFLFHTRYNAFTIAYLILFSEYNKYQSY